MNKLLILAALAAIFAATGAHAQSYDANGHYLRLPTGYADRQGQGTYQYQQTQAVAQPVAAAVQPVARGNASMYPADMTTTQEVVTTTTTTMQPLSSTEVAAMPAVRMAPAPVLTVSDAASANSLMPAAGPMTISDRSTVKIGQLCDTGSNHRARNKMMNTSTTVSNDCID